MPRNTRNFWIELEVDGRKTKIATGPVRKDGGFRLRIKQRDHGDIADQDVCIEGHVTSQDGIEKALVTSIVVPTMVSYETLQRVTVR